MKTITIDDELYSFIASQTKHIGESASDILRRILIDELGLVHGENSHVDVSKPAQVTKAVREINKIKKPSDIDGQHEDDNVIDAAALFKLLKEDEFTQPMSKVERFLKMLGALHQSHSEQFKNVLEIKGKGRLYFAKDKDTLLKSGSSTNPKPIPNSSFWVVTNNNTAKKRAMLVNAAKHLGYSKVNAERLGDLFDT
ncbi:MAG: replication initiation negative regulator SeqA [Aliiglaciecola sp.]|uniref:replication initiation negative regulator SeqA n=1 Tax=Aliiglaciecola sp. M165 TaxID=2593649 RepID=UPI00117D7D41|nr:replication initiation negative regulator SeqA [Aliiglaciecola sp. M165]TRY29327.1 replication initiation negative regulator SeqA [Aliiglaciecola sp. M165]